MKLTVIGCAGSYPGVDGPASCYLVEQDGHRVVLDMGNGALGPLQGHTDIYDIDAVLLSHLHVDHCIDLCSYYVARKYHPEGPRDRIPVFGPSNTAQRMASAYGLSSNPGMNQEFNFIGHQPQAAEIGPFTITTARVAHPVEAYAIRVEADGRSLVFSGDTGPTDALVDLARDADLALFEASLMDGPDIPVDLHLTGGQAAAHANRAGVPQLMLTHLVSWNDNEQVVADAEKVYDGRLMVAEPGMSVEF